MGQQNESPKYATLLYDVLHNLEISIPEYFYLDMVYHLSRDGWCYKSLDSVAKDMRMHRNGVQKMKTRLIEKGLIRKNIKGHVKTTVIYHSVVRQPSNPSHSVTNRNTQWYRSITLSGTKNNIENNKEKGISAVDLESYEKAREKAEEIRKQRGWLKAVDNLTQQTLDNHV